MWGEYQNHMTLRSRLIRLASSNPELRPHLLPLLRTASDLDGMQKQKVVRLVNKLMEPFNKGATHRDNAWAPVQGIWKAFEKAGVPFGITGSQYEKEDGVNVRKVWTFEVPFLNEKQRPTMVYGRVVAAGNGPSSEPLESYDITAYAN